MCLEVLDLGLQAKEFDAFAEPRRIIGRDFQAGFKHVCLKSRRQVRFRVKKLNFISEYAPNLDKSFLILLICKAIVLKWFVDEITYRFNNLWFCDTEFHFGVLQRCHSLNCGNSWDHRGNKCKIRNKSTNNIGMWEVQEMESEKGTKEISEKEENSGSGKPSDRRCQKGQR